MRQVRWSCRAGILALGVGVTSPATGQEGQAVPIGELDKQRALAAPR
jgi:hypothetical protein